MMMADKINVELLERVKAHILEEPNRFDMGLWIDPEPVVSPPCGTVACIGGWALILANQELRPKRICQMFIVRVGARKVLGLTVEQANRLFVLGNWPESFRADYRMTRSNKEIAEVAARRIDHFIKTSGEE